jgi:hypothetical protein
MYTGGVEGIPKFYHKFWHPPPQKRRKIFNTPLKGDEMFRTPPPAPNQSPSTQKHKILRT